jgi:hypothetical protein
MERPEEPVGGATSVADEAERARRKEQKRLADATRPLDSWERYRALNDATDEAYDLIDIHNREARFALIVMGGLNAALFVAVTRGDLLTALSPGARIAFRAAMVLYGVLAVYFLIQAIELLRPRRFRPHAHPPDRTTADGEDFPLGIRYYEDVILRDVDGHWRAWRDVHIGQLNAELAIQLHSLCLTNRTKHVALRRLYAGLRAMAILVAASAAVFTALAWL